MRRFVYVVLLAGCRCDGGVDSARDDSSDTAGNRPPVATDDAATTTEDDAVALPVLANDSDPDGDALSVASVDTTGALGEVTIDGTGGVTWSPAGRFESLDVGETATDTFAYTVADDAGATATATATVTVAGVNDAPIAHDDAAATTEDVAIDLDVVGDDVDPEGDPLTVTSATGGRGALSITGEGRVRYDPTGAFDGLGPSDTDTDTFTYVVVDAHGASDTGTVVVTVGGVQDPASAVDDDATTDEDTPVPVAVLANDTDPDSSLALASVDDDGTLGTIAIDGAEVVYDPRGAFDHLEQDAEATDTFAYTLGGGESATVTVTITGVNDPVVAVDDVATTDQDTAVEVAVLGNDVDPDSTLSVEGVDATDVVGALTSLGDGVRYDPAGAFASLRAGQQATVTFGYTVTDGHGTDAATVTVTIVGVDDPPVATDDAAETDEDTAIRIAVADNDADVDSAPAITALDDSGTTGAVHVDGAEVVYDPRGRFDHLAPGETATDTFRYTWGADGASDTALVTVTVTGVNDLPTAVTDLVTTTEDAATDVAVKSNDRDPDSTLVISAVLPTPATKGTVTLVGQTVTYDPDGQFEALAPGQTGSDVFEYTLADGATVVGTVEVTVTGVNDAPAVTVPAAQSGTEGDTVSLAASAADPEGHALTFSATNLPAGIAIDTASGAITGTLSGTAAAASPYTVTVRATDALGAFGQASFTWTVVDPPAPCVARFTDVTTARGLGGAGRSAILFDADGDGDLDLFVRQNGLFVNDGAGRFTEEAAARGITGLGYDGWGPTSVGDIDGDGDLDLFLGDDTRCQPTCTLNQPNRLYLNDGSGSFVESATAWGLSLTQTTARATPFADPDRDHDLDLTFASEFGDWRQFRNDRTPPLGNDNSRFSTHFQGDGAAWADPDHDGDFDLYVATGSSGTLNRYFLGGGTAQAPTWTEVAVARGNAGPAGGQRWGSPTWVDLDGDGDLDLHQVMNGDANDLWFRNDGATWVQGTAAALGLGDATALTAAAAWADYDADGDLDAFLPGSGLFARGPTGTFTLVSAGIATTGDLAAWGDVDGDGRLDLVVGGAALKLYQGGTTVPVCVANDRVTVRALTDGDGDATDATTADDRDAVGAEIRVDLDGDGDFAAGPDDRLQIWLVGAAQSGGHAQSALAPTIGLGGSATVDVRVRFPDGSTVTVEDVGPGDLVVRDTAGGCAACVGWRQILDLTGAPGAGTGYPIRLRIGATSAAVGADLHLRGHAVAFPTGQGVGGDLAFYGSDGTTPLPFWVESVTAGVATVWVRVAADLGANTTVQLHYGNPATPNGSNGPATFALFDTFDGTALDTSKWVVAAGSGVVSGGALTVGNGGNPHDQTHSLATFGVGHQVVWYGQINDESVTNARDGFDKDSQGVAFWTAWNVPKVSTYIDDASGQTWVETAAAKGSTHHFQIQRLSDGSARFYLDGVQQATPTGRWTAPSYVSWHAGTGTDVIQYVLVGKVVDVEPSFAGSRGEAAL